MTGVACSRLSSDSGMTLSCSHFLIFADPTISKPGTGSERRCQNVPFFLGLSSVSEMSTHLLKRNARGGSVTMHSRRMQNKAAL